MKKYEYIVVGAGFFGSVFAREMTDAGFSCLVIDKRPHIGGNCFTEEMHNIPVHIYGPHIFRTNSKKIWDYVNKFTEFEQYCNRVKVSYKEKIYSFPINLFTLYQLWGVKSPEEARKKLEEVKIKNNNPSNLEEYLLSVVGEEIYKIFFYGYTKKQWGKEPKDLPKSLVSRIPIRLNMDDNYYKDVYQGIPKNGYTEMFEKMLEGIDVKLSVDYLSDKSFYDKNTKKKIVYTGAIDEFFSYDLGKLEWRSLKFQHQVYDFEDYQGNSVINYTDEEIPYTRVTEHKHFHRKSSDKTVITTEFPDEWDISKEKYYPIEDDKNKLLYEKYKKRINHSKYIFGGRLAEYKYYDMHQVIGSALTWVKKELSVG